MLKNVNILLKRAGDTSVNIRNRDEVIAASNSQKNVRLLLYLIICGLEFFRYEKTEQTSKII